MNWYQQMKRQGAAPKAATVRAISTAERTARVIVPVGRTSTTKARYVVVPRGLRADSNESMNFLVGLMAGGVSRLSAGPRRAQVRMIDSVHENGAKLLEMSPVDARTLQAAQPGLIVVPEVFYKPAVFFPTLRGPPSPVKTWALAATLPFSTPGKKTAKKSTKKAAKKTAKKAAAGPDRMQIVVVGSDGNPVAEAAVIAYSNYAQGLGVDGVTDANGKLTISVRNIGRIERLYVLPHKGYWSALKRNVAPTAVYNVRLTAIDLQYDDCVRHYYKRGGLGDGAGVKVGIIDSGIALDHPDLKVDGGRCTIAGQPPASYGPLGGDHGTHVGGIIAARAVDPKGLRGLAPASSIFSYRVFHADQDASNFSIVRAIDAAVAEGCDLINMSLGGGPRDAATNAAIDAARSSGCVCIVAAGNDDRSPVSQPAAHSTCVAVSACGRKGTFPAGTADAADVAAPYGNDPNDFLAAFSNVGPEIDVAGPGVAVISTVPGGYAIMSGTSMACPAITGVAARLLAADQALLNAPRDVARADGIVRILLAACRTLGFGYNEEGHGLPYP